MAGHGPMFLYLVTIYIKHQSVVNFLEWDVESTSDWILREPIFSLGSSGLDPLEFSFHCDTIYKVWLCFLFTYVYNGVLVNM